MRTSVFPSVLFALLAGASVAVSAEAATPPSTSVEQTQAVTTKVNLNTADAPTLQRELSGVGEKKAQAIVDYREANGTFVSVDELLEVKGIGESILERNRDKLSVN
ncbi:competence protein ComEA [Pseudomonas cuatrocienegasensis]|uniref:Competence protein ComEA n=1 Tax=Pseudomonas cuatrocienegasensis TaxID=543360 RepID=A0ABY1B3L2_9PSED|nr:MULTISPECIES: ComEA family DNA-binding protein [Pseudomonas]OEC37090.1 competence protein ComEA [Pseudomonas sp. 21C1]SEP85168.1 competence protein ComEA [Pseudomonas cuatrocienegasensis]